MRIGLIARAHPRGLGYQTQSFYRNYKPDATLLVETYNEWPDTLEYGNDVIPTKFDPENGGWFERGSVERFLSDVDVVFSVETLYSHKFADICRRMKKKTIVQGNPEFWRRPGTPHAAPIPDVWVWPTDWIVDKMPTNHVLPVPMSGEVDPLNWEETLDLDEITFLHVAGHIASGDRNGTHTFIDALKMVKRPMNVRIVGQDGDLVLPGEIPDYVNVEFNPSGLHDRWDLYRDCDVLVAPRKYGGLSMPALEAMECGLAVLMTDCSPNHTWPILPIRCTTGKAHPSPYGQVPLAAVRPRDIAREMDRLAGDVQKVSDWQRESLAFAAVNTWEQLRPLYEEAWEL